MKKVYINGQNWKWLAKGSAHTQRVEEGYKGSISVVNIHRVKYPVVINAKEGELCLYNDGYTCVTFLPDDHPFAICATYNEKGHIVQWYIDMIKDKGVDEDGSPYFMDLYLDIVVTAKGEVLIFDEDELQEALAKGEITKNEYQMAWDTCRVVKEQYITDAEFMVNFFERYREVKKD